MASLLFSCFVVSLAEPGKQRLSRSYRCDSKLRHWQFNKAQKQSGESSEVKLRIKISSCFVKMTVLFCACQLKVSNWWSEEALKESGHFQRLFICFAFFFGFF